MDKFNAENNNNNLIQTNFSIDITKESSSLIAATATTLLKNSSTLINTYSSSLSIATTNNNANIIFNPVEVWGPQRDSLLIVIPITIIYSIIFITGVIGNISTCIVIKKNRSMHTATNYYLFSLAISDFLLLISGVPQEVYYVWCKYPYVLGEIFCIGRGFIAETSANATVLTITAFTVERYVAICHPFMAHAMSKLNRATRIILAIWFTSFLTAIPQAAQFGVRNFNGYDRCAVIRIIIEHSFQLSTFIFFFAPMSIILILYILIGIKLHRTNVMRTTNGNILYRASITNNNKMKAQSHQGTKRVLKMLVAVVIAFFLCWAPFHAQRLIAVYGAEEYFRNKNPIIQLIYNVMTYISGVLYYLSTCINPLLYNIMSNKFRQAFKETLETWNIFTSKTKQPKQKYNFFSSTKRLRVTFQESNDYTSSSQREESCQSSSSWKNHDPMTAIDEYSKSVTKYDHDMDYCKNLKKFSRNNYNKNRNTISNSSSSSTYCDESLKDNKHHNRNFDHNNIIGSDVAADVDAAAIIKIDEIDLPSKDASLNVIYTREGDIQIRLLKKKKKSNFKRNLTAAFKFLTFFSTSKTSKSNIKRMGFYTPPSTTDDNDYDNSLLYNYKLNTKQNSIITSYVTCELNNPTNYKRNLNSNRKYTATNARINVIEKFANDDNGDNNLAHAEHYSHFEEYNFK